jgi:hypothetical protein
MRISDVKNGKRAKGQGDLLKFLEGKKTTPLRSLKAKCYECTNGYSDGKIDCAISDCPLYSFMPYRGY